MIKSTSFSPANMFSSLLPMKAVVILTACILVVFPITAESFTSSLPTDPSCRATRTIMSSSSKPFGVVVNAEIKPDRMDEFLKIIKEDAEGSRQEPGCLRFDVLQSQDDPNKFVFYEVYKDLDAVKVHKEQPHFKPWTEFKESGGVVSSVTSKMDGLFMDDFGK